ncbi:MAG: DNA replication protein DnaC [Chloroflexi bacterium RBG_16_50_9]|nr:MAG: DNA replication protein DnaC [Chloroflexi bacterium RBG_16_50_9]
MEHISEILKKQTRTNTSSKDMDTWSSAEEKSPASSSCPVCKGVGIVHPRLPSGEPNYRQVVPCRCVRGEMDSERRTRLQRYSNLGSLTRFTFTNLEPKGKSGNPQSQEQFSRVCQAAKNFAAEPKGWLILSGPSGSGKSHLAAAVANERISSGYPAFYITAPDLLDHLRSSFTPGSEVPYDEFFDQVRNTPLLVLDDLGAQTGTPWAKEKLDQLLTSRFNGELPTVIITITPVAQLDERLRTRLADTRLCQIYVLEEEQPSSEYQWGLEFELQKSMTFTSFQRRPNLPLEQQENLEKAMEVALEFAKSPDGWLVLQGVNGCGKTHLASAIVNYRYQAGEPALFVVVPEFLDHLRSTFSPESKISYDQLFESVKTVPLLVLDDFGEQSATTWAREKLYQLINYRYNARLPTVITTVFTLDEGEIEGRIASRLIDPKISNFFQIMSPDYRGDRQSGQKRASPRGKTGRYR